ncbi:efflux RND transporter periplasmic adaptor subunit [Pedobacter sp. N36a]|uniref:efflux RND transporter periplasmic adaptor subunit n=1 Tax=Pedobacter sp. N36a TaxID=2767996 RepID=UPI001656C607|nr:efflux RND transporter periplasmic adaptor subunit [Pedobacter sp. N36a]MBC8985034.1 efflux RND transporter periplasmic adaptor subunit [Pedobacter sp. N36a]
MKSIIFKYLPVLLIPVLIYGCSSSAHEESKVKTNTDESIVQLSPEQVKQIDLQLADVQQKEISTVLKLNGQIEVPPQNLVSVSVPLGGYLKSTQMLPGTKISKGQLLATIEDPQYIQLQQDYLSTKNKLGFALKEYNRQRELHSARAGSDKVFQQAENEYKNFNIESKALAEKLRLIGLHPAKLTEDNISRTIGIYSPINGYVSKVNVNIGKYVLPSDVIFELVNPNNIHLNLTVFEKDLGKIKIGQQVMAYSNARPDQQYRTKVALVSHALNEERSTTVHCDFEQYDQKLVPGMYMNASVQVNNDKIDALPEDAFVNYENKDYVFLSNGPQTFKMTEVKKGITEKGYTALNSDLKGKKIVVKGAYSLLMKLKNTSEE